MVYDASRRCQHCLLPHSHTLVVGANRFQGPSTLPSRARSLLGSFSWLRPQQTRFQSLAAVLASLGRSELIVVAATKPPFWGFALRDSCSIIASGAAVQARHESG